MDDDTKEKVQCERAIDICSDDEADVAEQPKDRPRTAISRFIMAMFALLNLAQCQDCSMSACQSSLGVLGVLVLGTKIRVSIVTSRWNPGPWAQ